MSLWLKEHLPVTLKDVANINDKERGSAMRTLAIKFMTAPNVWRPVPRSIPEHIVLENKMHKKLLEMYPTSLLAKMRILVNKSDPWLARCEKGMYGNNIFLQNACYL